MAQEGSGVNVIFRRSSSAPATPSPSSGVPTNWYDDVDDVPAGAGQIWSSFGTRPNAGTNWTWQTPVRVEGIDGSDGAPGGANPLVILTDNDTIPTSGTTENTLVSKTLAGIPSGGSFRVTASLSNVTGAVGQTSFFTIRVKVAGSTICSAQMQIYDDGTYSLGLLEWTGQAFANSTSGDQTVSVTRQRSGPSSSGGATYDISVTVEHVPATA